MKPFIRRLRRPALAVLVLLCVAAPVLGSRALRHLDVFRVRQVEVIGTRFIEPYAVLRAAGLVRDANVFDDGERWRMGVLTMPLVEEVEIRRRLPGAVEVHVREVEPVALVAGRTLRPVDAAGTLIPLDPAGVLLDLPLLTGVEISGGRLVRGAGVLNTLVALRRSAPELAERVSQLEAQGRMVRVVFRDETAEALLPLETTDVQIRQLRLAVADLTSRGELRNVRRIDLRFRDQVVVSFLTSPVS